MILNWNIKSYTEIIRAIIADLNIRQNSPLLSQFSSANRLRNRASILKSSEIYLFKLISY